MEALVLLQISKSAMLADLGSLTSNATNQLVVIEHTYKMVAPATEDPAEETRWGFWTYHPSNAAFQKTSDIRLALPIASAIALDLSGTQLNVLAEGNRSVPAYLMRVPLRDSNSLLAFEGTPNSQPVKLPLPEAGQVRLNPAETWNTTGLPCEEWLFNPQVFTAPENGDLYLALNTADARSILFQAPRDAKALKVFAFVPGLLEPFVQKFGKRTLLFGRKPPLPWSVFFHSVRYSGQYGPVALPLRLAELDAAGKTVDSWELSHTQQIGEPFLYAVASNEAKQLALAVVVGSKTAPKLRLYLSRDTPERFRLLGESALSAIPRRLTVALSPTHALVGLALRGAEGDEIYAQVVSVRP